MDTTLSMHERELFDAALDIDDPVERSRFLDRQCGVDTALRDHLRGLFAAHDNLGDFLATPPTLSEALGDTDTRIGDDAPAPTVDHYQLIRPIGRGGMGVVYLAQQTDPVRRQVALKIIKPGMDSREVVARFEAERQTLAMMDHPNIARVFDGGTTNQGYPYFAMELVNGLPITEYCDRERLDIHGRLNLISQVCHGVSHAHQKGIIHRDLKPSNVLVVELDGRPTAKVIDFGVAKAVQSEGEQAELMTRQGQWIGTPAYMSPEQTGSGEADIDTRSDVYSVGTLLYELLTGTTPLDPRLAESTDYARLQRLIRDQDAVKPSSVASESSHIGGPISRELDWIVLRTIEKDRQRRYQSVADLAADIDRYLHKRPVAAGPPSWSYQARKFATRNMIPLAAAAVVLLAVMAGATVSAWQAIRATRAAALAEAERARAERQFASAEQSRALAEQSKAEADQQRARAEDNLLESFAVATLIDDQLKDRPGTELLRTELMTATLDHFDRIFASAKLSPDHLRQLAAIYRRSAWLRTRIGALDLANDDSRKSLQIYQQLLHQNPGDLDLMAECVTVRINISYNLAELRQFDAAIEILLEEIEDLRPLVDRHPDHYKLKYGFARAHHNLGAIYEETSKPHEAARMFALAVPLRQELAGGQPNHALGQIYIDIANNKLNLGRYDEALEANQRALRIRRELLESKRSDPAARSQVASSHNHLGDVYRAMRQHDRAIDEYQTAIEMEQQLVAEFEHHARYHSRLANSYRNLADVYRRIDREEDALGVLEKALSIYEHLSTRHTHWQHQSARAHERFADTLLALDRREEARESMIRSIESLKVLKDQGIGEPNAWDERLQNIYGKLAALELELGNLARAEQATRDRWALVTHQAGNQASVAVGFSDLAKAVDRTDLSGADKDAERRRYLALAAQAYQQSLSVAVGNIARLHRGESALQPE